jgi:hypothetical protein
MAFLRIVIFAANVQKNNCQKFGHERVVVALGDKNYKAFFTRKCFAWFYA